MTRPEHVRCENCAYWLESDDSAAFGWCQRYAPRPLHSSASVHEPSRDGDDWCGEFRSEWPGETTARSAFARCAEIALELGASYLNEHGDPDGSLVCSATADRIIVEALKITEGG